MAAPLPARQRGGDGKMGFRPASGEALRGAHRFRTFQASPKDLSFVIWQVQRAGDPPSNREGHAMDERAWISDTQAMALYSTLLFFVIVLWVYVPA
jgi:hypothetical protein